MTAFDLLAAISGVGLVAFVVHFIWTMNHWHDEYLPSRDLEEEYFGRNSA